VELENRSRNGRKRWNRRVPGACNGLKGKACAEDSHTVAALSRRGYLAAAMPLSLSRDRIVALLNAAKAKRIAVVGDAMLDRSLITI